MSTSSSRLWPYGPRAALISVPVILVGLLAVNIALRDATGWPTDASEKFVLLGVFFLSLIPVALVVMDSLAERGAVVEYRGVKVDFSRVAAGTAQAISVPVNIGVPGRAVSDSDTSQILDALRQAVGTDVVVLDLESGQAWWETRMLVLVAGAARLGRPGVVVFLATDHGVPGRFQGWGKPTDLLRCLLQADRRYRESYFAAMAAARQWELVPPGIGVGQPAPQPWIQGLGAVHPWMAYNPETGLPNEHAAEQFLAADLGSKIETPERPAGISVVRLEELFRPVLHTEVIDETSSGETQLRTFLEGISPYVAVTHGGSYQRLLSRVVGLNAIIRALTEDRSKS